MNKRRKANESWISSETNDSCCLPDNWAQVINSLLLAMTFMILLLENDRIITVGCMDGRLYNVVY